ncbi:protease [Streptomyces eurocidicus]|uniref:Protease n=1 Tax=Streptomyces eurocidicus TaxID=66423 RepID=A0A2N8NRU7_STREU|nr:trypsin-like peptidase domain-containing protein [Streptomyces eurocidicus]PNE31497.1 protease [Streptomyces eurocidicus]
MDEGKAGAPGPRPHWWSRPAPAREAAEAADATTGGPAPGEGERSQATAPAPEPAAVPLHAPDPYGTPPYGGPGPWAPAPPVQRPVTPAHGTHVAEDVRYTTPDTAAPYSGAPPAYGTPPVPGATPPGGTGVPAPVYGSPYPAGATPPGGTGVPPSGMTSAYGTPHPAPDAAPVQGLPHPTPPGGTGMPGTTPPGATPPAGTGVPAPPYGSPYPAGATPPGGTAAPPPGMTPLYGARPRVRPDPAPRHRHAPRRAPARAVAVRPLGRRGAAAPGPDARPGRGRLVAGAVAVALVAGGVGGGIGMYLERDGGLTRHRVELPQASADRTARAPGSIAGIAARALPGVVTIHVRGGSDQGTGTGFVLDKEGRILTNNHVVEPAGSGGEISVTFNGGQTAKATVVGRDSSYDLAVIKVSGVSGLSPLALGNSDSVRVGDSVIAIGAPFDLAGTVTTGIISAKERPITAGGHKQDGSDVSYVDALQTDAPINPGNSGGPLMDSEARVIGINSAIRSAGDGSDLGGGQGGSIGLGFAIPINQAKRVAEELINTGKATHPVIGVTLDMEYTGDGARVNTKGAKGPAVTPGGPGDAAGIRSGDVIKKVDGVPVRSGQELIVKIRSHRPGDRLTLTVERDGQERAVPLTLGSAGSP